MKKSAFFVNIGRLALTVSFLSLLSAWWTQLSGGLFLGMNQQHLFSDATVLALIGIGSLVDGIIHQKEEAK